MPEHQQAEPAGQRTFVLSVVLLLAMFVGTFPQYALGVLGPLLAEDIGVSDLELGMLASVLFVGAAVVARISGRLIDHSSGRITLLLLFVSASGALLLFSISQSFIMLILAVLVGGIAIGANNPATNSIIARHVTLGRRGFVLATKQVGVKIAHLSAGLLIPAMVATVGWRLGLRLVVVLALVIVAVAIMAIPHDRRIAPARTARQARPEQRVVRAQVAWLRVYAAMMALGMSAITTYLPLFAVRDVGVSFGTAGLMVTATGGIAVLARIVYAALADRSVAPTTLLIALAGVGSCSLVIVALSPRLGQAGLWAGVVLAGATVGSWNVVVHLTIINDFQRDHAAAATGYMQSTFLVGLAVGAPTFGVIAEFTNSFPVAWGVGAVSALGALAIASRAHAHRRSGTPQGPTVQVPHRGDVQGGAN